MNSEEVFDWIKNNAELSFSRSGGPGGQYVNTSDTKVTLRLPIAEIPLPAEQKDRLLKRLDSRLNSSGELVLQSSETRSQAQNRTLAVERAHSLILAAMKREKRRKTTRPSRASRERRLARKKARAEKKRLRKPPPL